MIRRRQSAIRAANLARQKVYRPQLDVLETRLPPGDALFSLLSAIYIPTTAVPADIPSRERVAAADPVLPALATQFSVFGDNSVSERSTTSRSTYQSTTESAPFESSELPFDFAPIRGQVLRAPYVTPPISQGTLGESYSLIAPNAASPTTTIPTASPSRDGSMLALRQSPLSPKGQQPPPVQQRSPVSFEANVGQTDAQVHFLTRGAGYDLYLTSTEAVVRMGNTDTADAPSVVRMQYLGANPAPEVSGRIELATKVNYFHGRDSSQWQSGVSTFAQVEYQNLYTGINLVYYGNSQDELEYDFIVSPGADPGAIKLGFDGADRVRLDETGSLLLSVGDHELRQHAPVTYQEVNGVRKAVPSAYIQIGNQIGFSVGDYDLTRPLIIDPVISYSSYHGGNNTDSAESVTVDAAGNAYIVGFTNSSNFPSQNGAQKTKAGLIDAFVTKITPQGTVAFSTYFGGEKSDYARGVAVDAAGTIYVTGNTFSKNTFPVLNPFQSNYNRGKWDGFVAKFNGTGTLTYSTYLGGKGDDIARSIAIDAAGNMYVTGQTDSPNFPRVNAWQNTPGGILDAFLTKINANGQSLGFSTYLGGIQNEIGYDVAVDAAGNIHVTGHTVSTNFPTLNPFQPAYGGGFFDAFVAKFNPSGGAVFSSYLGGSDLDRAFAVAVDPAGNAYYSGQTWSANFPTLNPLQGALAGNTDVFVTKVTPAGVRVYSTYLGGKEADLNWGGFAVNSAGSAYIVGGTESADFPVVQPLQATKSAGRDAFVSVINPAGTALTLSTYLGGNNYDDGYGLALDGNGNMYVVGETYSTNFPLQNPWQATKNTFTDGFVTKIAP
jgi:hypothetical protein